MADTFQLAVDDRSAFDKAAALTLGTDQLSQGNGSRPHLERTKHHRLPFKRFDGRQRGRRERGIRPDNPRINYAIQGAGWVS